MYFTHNKTLTVKLFTSNKMLRYINAFLLNYIFIFRVRKTRMEHDGIFTCRPTLGTQDTVRVHIIDGK